MLKTFIFLSSFLISIALSSSALGITFTLNKLKSLTCKDVIKLSEAQAYKALEIIGEDIVKRLKIPQNIVDKKENELMASVERICMSNKTRTLYSVTQSVLKPLVSKSPPGKKKKTGPRFKIIKRKKKGANFKIQKGKTTGHRFKIQFDYRFDSENFFASKAKRKTMQAAASIFGNIISDDYPPIPVGSTIKYVHPETNKKLKFKLDKEVDDVLVLVFTANRGTKGNKATGGYSSSIYNRFKGKFRPRIIYLSINTTASRPWFFDTSPQTSWDIPNTTHYDIFSTTLHELGHGLGILLGNMKSTGNYGNNTFIGKYAKAANGGKAVILEKNSSHISRKTNKGLLRPNLDELLMHAVSPIQGFRFLPRKIDVAILRDLGYSVRMDQVPNFDDYPVRKDPRTSSYLKRHPCSGSKSRCPVGLWMLDDTKYLYNTILGHPLKYMYKLSKRKKNRKWKGLGDGLLVPQGGSFIIDHNQRRNGGGKCLNKYTLLMDIRIPKTGVHYSLYNTSATNGNSGDAWINKNGQIGQGTYSKEKITVNQWTRVALTVDIPKERRFFINGSEVLKLPGGKKDGRFSLGTSTCYHPLVHLFGDSKGEDSDIHVRQVAMYNYPLKKNQIKKMGGPKTEISY